MKKLIKKAGFKSQCDLGRHLGKNKNTVRNWVVNPPKLVVDYLQLRRIHQAVIKSGILLEVGEDYIEFVIEGKKVKVFD